MRATNWVGDAVMTMPAVQRLRELYPNAFIALLTPAKLHDLWRHNPLLNQIIPFKADIDLAQLRALRFDTALILPNSFRAAWEAWRARIPRRIGFAGHTRRALLTVIVPEPTGERACYELVTVAGKKFKRKIFPTVRHQVHRYLDLIAYLGGNSDLVSPKIWCHNVESSELSLSNLQSPISNSPPPDLSSSKSSPQSSSFSNLQSPISNPDATIANFLPADGKPLLALNAGAEFGPAKRWPADRFAAVARRVAEKLDCHWLLLGGPGDLATVTTIETALRGHASVRNLAGQTSLLELCQILEAARLLLTNDTGPMHLAAAVGTPLVAIFGSTSAELTGPLIKRAVILREPVECNPCFLRECPIDFRCMTRITVEQVTAAVLNSLAR